MKTDHKLMRMAIVGALVICLSFASAGIVWAEEPLPSPEEEISVPVGPDFIDPGMQDVSVPGSAQPRGLGRIAPGGPGGQQGQQLQKAGMAGKGGAFIREIVKLRQELLRKAQAFRAKMNQIRMALKGSKDKTKAKDLAEKAMTKAKESRELALKAKEKGQEARDLLKQVRETFAEDPEQNKELLQELKKNAGEVKKLLKQAIERIDQANSFADKALEALGKNRNTDQDKTDDIGLWERFGNAWNELTR